MAQKTKRRKQPKGAKQQKKPQAQLKWTKVPKWLGWLETTRWMFASYVGMGICAMLMRYYILQGDLATAVTVLWPMLILHTWAHNDR